LLDLPLPPPRKRALLAEGKVEQHRYTPARSGWVSLRIDDEADIATAFELLREQHGRATRRRRRAASG
jgi:Luciferase